MANKAALIVFGVVSAAVAAVLYIFFKPTEPSGEGEFLEGGIQNCYIDEQGREVCVAGLEEGSDGMMQDPIEQEDPHAGEPITDPDDYAVLAQFEREERKECPWDYSRFDSIASCYHHILDVHGGAPGPGRELQPNKVPLLRYQKIPVLVRVTDGEGFPVIGQLVELKRMDGAVVKADYTDGSGGVDFLGLDPGQYRITIDALPAYSQVDLVYTFDFIPEKVTLNDFSGNPVEMEFMQPYLQAITLRPPGWSLIATTAPTIVAPGPIPAPTVGVSLDDIRMSDGIGVSWILGPLAGEALSLKIGKHTAGVPQSFTSQELLYIAEGRYYMEHIHQG